VCVCGCVGDLFGLMAWCVRVPFVFRLRDGEFRAVVIRCLQNGDHGGGSVDGQHGTVWLDYLFSLSDDLVKGLVKPRAHRGRVRMDGDEGWKMAGNDPRHSPLENRLRQSQIAAFESQ
jgi:hypothetical protein